MAPPKQERLSVHLGGVHWMQIVSPPRWGKVLWLLLFLYLVLFPFGQFIRLPLPFLPPEVRVYATDILVGLIGVIWLFSLAGGRLARLRLRKEFFVFPTASLFSLLLAVGGLEPKEILVSSLYLIRLVSYFLFVGAVWDLVRTKEEQSLILNSLVCVGCAISVFGLVQYVIYPDLRVLLTFGWDEHLNRIVGTFLDPNFTSIILVFTLILLSSRVLHLRGVHWVQRVSPRRWAWALILVIFSALLLTYSRSGYLAFVAGMGALSYLARSPKIFLLSSAAILMGIFLLPKQTSEGTKLERTTSAILRIENLKEGVGIFREHPVFGVGFNTLRYTRPSLAEEKYGPSHAAAGIDNSFLFVLVTTGIVGFAAFINLAAVIVKESLSFLNRGRVIIIPTFAALFVHAMFVNSLFYPWALGWLALLLAGTLRAVKD